MFIPKSYAIYIYKRVAIVVYVIEWSYIKDKITQKCDQVCLNFVL